jgi:hypothetical protein
MSSSDWTEVTPRRRHRNYIKCDDDGPTQQNWRQRQQRGFANKKKRNYNRSGGSGYVDSRNRGSGYRNRGSGDRSYGSGYVDNQSRPVDGIVSSGKIAFDGYDLNGCQFAEVFDAVDVKLGQMTVDMGTAMGSAICNLSYVLFPESARSVWQRTGSFQDRVDAMLRGNEMVKAARYFIAPIDLDKQRRVGGARVNRNGRRVRLDVPNLTFACVAWLLENYDGDVIFVDPRASLTDRSVRADNLSALARHLRKCVAPMSTDRAVVLPEGGMHIVNYQRNNGNLSERERADIERYLLAESSADSVQFLRVQLSPPKYDNDSGRVSQRCYREFAQSIARLSANLSLIPQLIRLMGGGGLSSLEMVLDEFGGYALYTCAILRGLNLDHITSVLCYSQGAYTRMPACAPSIRNDDSAASSSSSPSINSVRPELE